MARVINVQDLTMRIGARQLVAHAGFRVDKGMRIGLVGRNGAGKSTLFKIMLGLLAPTSGSIHIAGEPVGQASALQVRRRIGYLPENVALWDNLSGLETLKFFARLKGLDTAGCAALLTKVGLEHAGDRPVRAYSKGMRQRLGFAQALQGNPQVLFLDEPTTGLHFHDIALLLKVLTSLRDQGNTLVIIEHNLDVIKTADWLIDMGPEGGAGGGHLVAAGTPETVAACEASHTGRYLRPLLGMKP